MLESMMKRADSAGSNIDPQRMVANGVVMLVAGILSYKASDCRRNQSLYEFRH